MINYATQSVFTVTIERKVSISNGTSQISSKIKIEKRKNLSSRERGSKRNNIKCQYPFILIIACSLTLLIEVLLFNLDEHGSEIHQCFLSQVSVQLKYLQ